MPSRSCSPGTAWHWVSPGLRNVLAHRALVPGGALAPFWNRPVWDENELRPAFDAAYAEVERKFAARPAGPMNPFGAPLEIKSDQEWLRDEFRGDASFADLSVRNYRWVQAYGAADYIRLIGTHSDHILLPEGGPGSSCSRGSPMRSMRWVAASSSPTRRSCAWRGGFYLSITRAGPGGRCRSRRVAIVITPPTTRPPAKQDRASGAAGTRARDPAPASARSPAKVSVARMPSSGATKQTLNKRAAGPAARARPEPTIAASAPKYGKAVGSSTAMIVTPSSNAARPLELVGSCFSQRAGGATAGSRPPAAPRRRSPRGHAGVAARLRHQRQDQLPGPSAISGPPSR